jgi:sulfur carrier protein
MTLTINGQKKDVPLVEGSLVELLRVEKVEMPDMVTVELNGAILSREEQKNAQIREEDKIEFLYFMGGGSRETGGGMRMSGKILRRS